MATDELAVREYLQRIAEFVQTLCSDDLNLSPGDNPPGVTIDSIARTMLMDVCSLNTIISPLPESLKLDTSQEPNISPYGPNSKDTKFVCVVKTRSDALRYLFYSLAPVALDIGARITSHVKSFTEATGKIPCDITSKAFVLFSLWLPHAPQLSSLVTELFSDDRFRSPFECLTSPWSTATGLNSITTKQRILLGEAAHSICKFYYERGVHKQLLSWWDWSILFSLLPIRTPQPSQSTSLQGPSIIDQDMDPIPIPPLDEDHVARWHGARALAYLYNMRSSAQLDFFKYQNVEEDKVSWTPHPWVLLDEETRIQGERIRGEASIVKNNMIQIFKAPTLDQIRNAIPLHSSLVHIGHGLLIHREGTDKDDHMAVDPSSDDLFSRLIMTPTTARNLALLGTALLCADPYPTPILVCGPRGAGKSSIIRELAQCRSKSENGPDLLELHVDEEIDSKTLLGLFTVSDVPGEFTWRPGPLTVAARTGKWVLIEDVDQCPTEIQAALVKLLESRILPLGIGRDEKCHENFRIFGTCTTRSSTANPNTSYSGRKVLHSDLWTHIHVLPLPYDELGHIGKELFPTLPTVIITTVLNIFRMMDSDGRVNSATNTGKNDDRSGSYVKTDSALTSVRDLIKLLRRISTNVKLEQGTSFITETQRIVCLVETVDVLIAAKDTLQRRLQFVTNIAAPAWELSIDFACKYIMSRCPVFKVTSNYLEIGRCTLRCNPKIEHIDGPQRNGLNFSKTTNVLQLMETIGVCLQLNEPILLVGETGCGKTTAAQSLAKLAGFELVVQNLSFQTDSADLLGGYRPVDMNASARQLYLAFVDIFTSTFSRAQNSDFLTFVATAYEQRRWKLLSQCFRKASKMGLNKLKDKALRGKPSSSEAWEKFASMAERFERQRNLSEAGLAFSFIEGVLVEAITNGKWVLLDEINLASGETLQRLCSLLDDSKGSLTITERGDSDPIKRHPDFRLIAAMNPATDTGKKDLPESIRSRFTEIYVDELTDRLQLNTVAAGYLRGVIHVNEVEQSESVMSSVDVYLRCRALSEETLVDSGGQRPRYSMRTFCRALLATYNLTTEQRIPLNRAILEGFQLTFEGSLDGGSILLLKNTLYDVLGKKIDTKALDVPGRRPGGKNGCEDFVLIKPFWLKVGPLKRHDWAIEDDVTGKCRFVLTPSARSNLRRLSRAIAAGPWPVLLEGPTSTGKTTLVEYVAALCGHRCIRINNHEHTDVQEYTGTYSTNPEGQLSFQEGLLVQALRHGHWVILDELNLAPSQVLEALNRLLDDNRELYIPELNELIKPHENFRLFATQNPTGVYGGRKALSKAFRNRFTELYVDEMPEGELVTILDKRCGCPPSHGKLLVEVMTSLRKKRSKSGVFNGKDGLITPRVLIRWAERRSSSKANLATEGYMLLAERLRDDDEKRAVQSVIESVMKVDLNIEELYWGPQSDARRLLEVMYTDNENEDIIRDLHPLSIAPTKSLLRLITLVDRCVQQKEPVLLVGETGIGKTTVVQLFQILLRRRLQVINCHANTDTSDLLGGLRPLRGRNAIYSQMIEYTCDLEKSVASITATDFPFHLEPQLHSFVDQEEAVNIAMDYVKKIESMLDSSCEPDQTFISERCGGKRRKIENIENIRDLIRKIQYSYKRYFSLFEWIDGPLVSAMKSGSLFLLDEMSLAEDAVLERINSVLEPSRMLTLAEKVTESAGSIDGVNLEVVAHEDFRIFATMNPGGDYGKRELSPALRSRFTEIWVPPVVDRTDIDLVLERSLRCAFDGCKSHDEGLLREFMLEYVGWFNTYLHSAFGSPKIELVLSLRDVITWSTFIKKMRQDAVDIGLFESYLHGASLMHLDGLGLGTGLSREEAKEMKRSAGQYLSNQIASIGKDEYSEVRSIDLMKFVHSDPDKYGIHPFYITAGPYQIPSSLNFNLNAPTTRVNMLRVFRAMQLSKPILLEGSPGTGKTSLIAALANATGHKLVRINLSDQTDWSDLMGSDLPVTDDCQNKSGPVFKWCDGILLAAIKNGDWVILDELNLATQSVLEGLNSCLDHRANVYIPELGITYSCPESFRIFAAQNPLFQGGGRKGLPKSFLNRFTKVFVESMTRDDYYAIMSTKFPRIPAHWLDKMIEFNAQLETDIVSNSLFGHVGSPWEFNLRDLFRWGNLMMSSENRGETMPHPSKFIDTIYIRRLRTEKDRETVLHMFHAIFHCTNYDEQPSLLIHNDSLICGSAILPILEQGYSDISSRICIRDEHPGFLRSLLLPMEVAAHCICMNWHCLFVGSSGCGKSSIIKTLSELCNSHLEELYLTTSTDVSELIGNFEQVDKNAVSKQFLEDLKDHVISISFVLSKQLENIEYLLDINRRTGIFFSQHCMEWSDNVVNVNWISNSTARSEVDGILQSLSLIHQTWRHEKLSDRFVRLCSDYQKLRQLNTSIVQFRWVDGILVQALERGYWLHLGNVNLCSSSVLDRLNPLLEECGELVLTECSVSHDGLNEHRVIKAHPNFRLFLSMDPAHGEISRAMRNRCVEISLSTIEADNVDTINDFKSQESLVSLQPSIQSVDILESMWDSGIRSPSLARSVIGRHRAVSTNKEISDRNFSSLRFLKRWSSTISASLLRGASFRALYDVSYGAVYSFNNYEDQHFPIHDEESFNNKYALVEGATSRRLEWYPPSSRAWMDSRLLRIMTSSPEPLLPFGSYIACSLKSDGSCSLYENISFPVILLNRTSQSITNQLTIDFVLNLQLHDVALRSSLFDGYRSYMSKRIQHLSRKYIQYLDQIVGHSDATDSKNFFSLSNTKKLLLHNRLTMCLTQFEIMEKIHTSPGDWSDNTSDNTISVVEVSLRMYVDRQGRADIQCPLTPLIYPLIVALDEFLDASLVFAYCSSSSVDELMVQMIIDACTQAFRFLHCLRKLPYQRELYSVAFDQAKFRVQWRWMKKQLVSLFSHILETENIGAHDLSESYGRLKTLVEFFDRSLHLDEEDIQHRSDVYWKRMGHPLVPAKAVDHLNIVEIARISACVWLWHPCNDNSPDSFISVQRLLLKQHPILYIDVDNKMDALNTLCMALWATTDEMSSITRSTPMAYDTNKATVLLHDKIMSETKEFQFQLEISAVDLSLGTVENLLNAEELQRLNGCYSKQVKFHEEILRSYASIQISPISEFGCILEEQSLVRIMLELGSASKENVVMEAFKPPLIQRLKAFIENVSNFTCWPASDLRPYQTILWACTSDKFSSMHIRNLLRSSSSIMISAYFHHCWLNGYNDPSVIDQNLGLHDLSIMASDQQSSSRQLGESKNYVIGPPRLRHNIISNIFFHILNFGDARMKVNPWLTLENYKARLLQSKRLNTILSSLSFEAEADWNVNLGLFTNLLETVSSTSSMGASVKIMIEAMLENCEIPYHEIEQVFATCRNPAILKMMDSIVRPLISLLKNKSAGLGHENKVLGLLYIGLLRFHLILPSSDIDPGLMPTIKVIEINDFIATLSERITARRMISGINNGDFSARDTIALHSLHLAEKSCAKRERQLKKQVQRPDVGPSFTELYREVSLFAENVVSVSAVLRLIEIIKNGNSAMWTDEFIEQTENNWQQSVHSFIYRLRYHYCYYHDVTLPLLASLQAVQYGVRELVALKLQHFSPFKLTILRTQDSLLSYPRQSIRPPTAQSFIDNLEAIEQATDGQRSGTQIKSIRESYLCCVLSRLNLFTNLRNGLIDHEQIVLMNAVFSKLGEVGLSPYEASSGPLINTGESVDERDEKLFREVFPDHEADILGVADTSEHNSKTGYYKNFQDSMLYFLCGIYLRMFSPLKVGVDDHTRIHDFVLAYKAAGLLQGYTSSVECQIPERNRIVAHVYAFMLELSPQINSMALQSVQFPADGNSTFDFHHDPCPWLTICVKEPLENIQDRLQQLMSAFPANSVLMVIYNVVKKLRQYDLKRTSLGKMLTGLEVILRKAQDWEQHASVHVHIGQPLVSISAIVSKWRKIELQSWPKLLDALEKRHRLYAQKSWYKLYHVIITNVEGEREVTTEGHNTTRKLRAIPHWILHRHRTEFHASTVDFIQPNVIKLIQVVDTFVLTSTVGQFSERLRMIEGFANHQMIDFSMNPRPFTSAKAVGLMLHSLYKYYEQFISKVDDTKTLQRSPIEKKLVDEVRLAKWDDQSYYSLAESSEKTHRMLMKHLKEYNETLETAVCDLIDQVLVEGVTPSQTCVEMPSNRSVFPLLDNYETESQNDCFSVITATRDVFDHKFDIENKWIYNMKKYYDKLIRMSGSTKTSVSQIGASTFSIITTSIFDRVNTLRNHGSKNLKQRALLDLFQTLKDQGFSISVTPYRSNATIRDMSTLLIIPHVAKQESNKNLHCAERYWYRCIAEINRLRDEVNSQGSKFMNQREMQMMLNCSEHGLLMLCQQRSVLASVYEDLASVDHYVSSYEKITEAIPRHQDVLTKKVICFDEAYLTAGESLSQLVLILKTATEAGGEGEERDHNAFKAITSAITLIEKNNELLRKVYLPRHRYSIVTHTDLDDIRRVNVHIKRVVQQLSNDLVESQLFKYLPTDIVSPCLSSLETLLQLGDDCAGVDSVYDVCISADDSSDFSHIEEVISSIVQTTLLVAQSVNNIANTTVTQEMDESDVPCNTVWENHHKACAALVSNRIIVLVSLFSKLSNFLLVTDFGSNSKCTCYSRLIFNAAILARTALSLLQRELIMLSDFHRNASKFLYIITRIFRTLVAQGYCSDDGNSDKEQDEGNMNNTKFEDDVAGTGMGQGEGNVDVSDQIENEEQLLGLKGDNDNGDDSKVGEKKLKEDERDKGMEMEAEFEGEMFDAPQKEDEKSGDAEENMEEINRELGDGNNPNEEVIDEKLWDDDDDEDDGNRKSDEKFEKNSKVHDTTSSDEVRTKDEDEKGSDEIPTSSLKANNDHANDDHSYKSDEQEGGQDFPVNEDLEENYEDRHDGISVRQPDDVDMTNDDDDLKLDDMNLDDNESVDSDSKNEGSSIGNVADELNNHLEDDTQVGDVPESNNESPPDGDIHTPDEKDGSDLQDDSDSMTASGVNDQDHNQRKATDAQGIHDENGRDEISELFQQQEDNHRAKGDEMKEERQETDIDGGKEGLNIDDRRFHSGDDGIRQDLGDNLESTANIPNPFRDPGDAEKYWHRRLNLLHRSESNGDMNIDDEIKEDEKPQPQNSAGLYEFVQSNQSSSAQVLADSDENNDVNIQPKDKSKEIKREPQSNDPMETLDDGADVEDNGGMGKSGKKSERNSKVNDRRHSDEDGAKEGEEKGSDENLASSSETNTNHGQKLNELNADQYSLLHGDSEEKFEQTNIIAQQHESQSSGTDNAAILWGKLQSETHHLSRRLCEKLRLVMEPLVASKLQGDYRSGKRLNMKRIISYIASGYRKDKIWLRRTKPAKRDYRVMLAVDDSESMKSSGAGLMALRAISMLINGMTQLEVGQLGIASFGEEMKILHPFECPFTSESGASLVGNFRFEDKRTRTALCVESAMASMARESSSLSPQLLLLISDGRIERDSRSRLRSSLREMSEQNILVVMLIIEGSTETKKKDRILDIKEVSFEDGKPKVNFFMDNYPFPYYIIVEDLNDLPEILGDALRQWFEILAQTQK